MQNQNSVKEKILVVILFIAVFINFLGPIIDPDFPFHLKSGEYIYQHMEIPNDDPFSFYGEGIVTDWERLVLAQYWVAQVIFYGFYSMMGPSGIILLRATVFTAFVFLLWIALRNRGFYSSLIIVALTTIMLQASKGDRPQFFSFLFTLILILLIEKFRKNPESARPLYFIPPLILIWANMHGGFVFGIAIIAIYSLSEALKFFVNKTNLTGQPLKRSALLLFVVISLSAVLLSYINPVVNGQILATLEPQLNSGSDTAWRYEFNNEYRTPVAEMSYAFGIRRSAVIFFILFGYISIITLLNNIRSKSRDITVFILILFSSAVAFTAVRYIPFFVATAIPLSRDYKFFRNIDVLKNAGVSFVSYILLLSFFIFAIVFGLRDYANIFTVGQHIGYPENAVNFLLENPVKANIFNQHNKGSYLLWKLYPDYKVLNDTRLISSNAYQDTKVISNALEDYDHPPLLSFADALSSVVPEELGSIVVSSEDSRYNSRNNIPLWKRLLDQNNIDILVHEATVDFTFEIYPLTLRLINDDDWVLIYFDGTMQIFIRNIDRYSRIIEKYRKPKESIYDEIVLETTPYVRQNKAVSTLYSSLAFALMMNGKVDDARTMIDAALAFDNEDFVAHFCKAYLALLQNVQERARASGNGENNLI
jgi:hypothetical protein